MYKLYSKHYHVQISVNCIGCVVASAEPVLMSSSHEGPAVTVEFGKSTKTVKFLSKSQDYRP